MNTRRVSSESFALALIALLALFPLMLQQAWADEDSLASASDKELLGQLEGRDYESADGLVRITGITSGEATYDEQAKTLTLNDARAAKIDIRETGDVLLLLVGENECAEVSCIGNLTIAGKGELSSPIMTGGNLEQQDGIVNANSEGDYADMAVWCSGTFTMSGGVLTANSKGSRITCVQCGNFVMNGGTLTATAQGEGAVNAISCSPYYEDAEHGNAVVKGGTLVANSFGSNNDAGIWCKSLEVEGGSVNVTVTSRNSGFALGVDADALVVRGGTLAVSTLCEDDGSSSYGIKSNGIVIDGGSISLSECKGDGVHCTGTVGVKSGSLSIEGQRGGEGVNCNEFNMTGGRVEILRSEGDGIVAQNVVVQGGSLTVQVNDTEMRNAVEARSITAKESCLKDIKGGMNVLGFTFESGGNTYVVSETGRKYDGDYESCKIGACVELAKYGGQATELEAGNVVFGGYTYCLEGVKAGAFATERGSKVVSASFANGFEGKSFTLEPNAFNGASNMRTLAFGNRIESLPENAFYGMESLEEMVFNATLMGISPNAFNGAKTLKTLTFNNYVSRVPSFAFKGADSLETVFFNDLVDIIEANAFEGAGSLKTMRASSVNEICANAFSGANSLVSLTICPVNMRSNAFGGATALKKIIIETGDPGTFRLPSNSFDGLPSLETVAIHGRVAGIATNAFNGATSLKNITFDANVTYIASKAFNGASALKSLTFDGKIWKLRAKAFYGATSLKSITFNGDVSYIASKAFSGANALKSLKFNCKIYDLRANAFSGAKSLQSLFFGGASSTYTATLYLRAKAFSGTKALTSIQFKAPGTFPFKETRNKKGKLKAVKWVNKLTIEEDAFSKCGKGGGKNLTVSFKSGRKLSKADVKAYKKLFTSKGLSSSFKLKGPKG